MEPLIVMGVPVSPEKGFNPLIKGVTVNKTPLLAPALDTATTTFPVLAPFGTGTTMLVWLQLVGVPKIPLKATVLPSCCVPKFVPAMVTEAPTGPDVGLKPVIVGVTVNKTPLLATPPNVTTTFPVVAPAGTGTAMAPALQFVGVARAPLNVTVLVPWDGPQFPPTIVTDVPTGPEEGLSEAMLGARTVKVTPLVAKLLTVTTTLPVVAPLGTGATMFVALQLVGVAVVPLKVTVLVPCEAPKFVPVIVTEVPTEPDVGDRLVMLGLAVKGTPLLASPLTVTTTLPVVAPLGSGTTMLVALQLVGVAAVPLNVTVLLPCAEAKFVPVIVTEVPTGPEAGLMLVMLGAIAKLPA